ncbi:MAG: nucleotidyltransferase [Planctomycetes bacterium]|nr:nucleotidyltransferase [Planctomycetota bacterium]
MSLAGLVDTVHWLEDLFEQIGLRRSYGGAIAYNYHGPPRLTQDIDVLVLVPDTKIPALVEALASAGCLHGDEAPRRVELRPVLDDFRGKAHLAVFLCRGIRTELFVPWHPFHHRVLERSPERDLEGRKIRIHSPEDLIVFKKIFDRPKDIGDIKAILMAQKGKLDLDRLRSDAKSLLTENSHRELEAIIDQFG